MENENICNHCGNPKPDWPPFGPLASVRDDNAVRLVQFFRGELDLEKCNVCGQPLAVPSVVVSFDDFTEDLIFYGPLARKHPDFIRSVEEDATKNGTAVLSGFESPEKLREAVWQRIMPRVVFVFRALDDFYEDFADQTLWETIWPGLTSAAFAGAMMAVQVEHPCIIFNDAELIKRLNIRTAQQVLQGLQRLQARAWNSLCCKWKASNRPNGTLEEDLKVYVEPWSIFLGAPELFFKQLETQDWTALDPATKYAFEATRSSLYTTLGLPNPHAMSWASTYLTVETLSSSCEEELAKFLRRLAVSEERASNTLDKQALAAAVSGALSNVRSNGAENDEVEHEAIQAAVTKARHPDLLGAAYTHTRIERKGGEALKKEDILMLIEDALKTYASEPDKLEVRFNLIRQSLPSDFSTEDLLAITQQIEINKNPNPLSRAVLRYSIGRIICLRRQPKPYLRWIGEEPETWESNVPLTQKCVLWLWRARALKLMGHSGDAFNLLKSLAEENELSTTRLPVHLRQNVWGDLALAYIDLGYYEHALGIQTALLEEPEVAQSPWHLRAVANTYAMLGREKEAIPLLQKALLVSTPADQEIKHEMEAQLAYLHSRCGQSENAIEILNNIPDNSLKDSEVFLSYSAAWFNVSNGETNDVKHDLQSTFKRVSELSLSSLAQGDTQLHMAYCRFAASLSNSVAIRTKTKIWELIDSGARLYEGNADPKALVALALKDWESGDFEGGRTKLMELPESLARRFADTSDITIALNALDHQLDKMLKELGNFVLQSDIDSSDRRLVSELQRDLLGRVAARKSSVQPSGFITPGDLEVVRIMPKCKSVGVLEWVSGTQNIAWLFTQINPEGDVKTWTVEPPALDVERLSKKIHQRLQNWYRNRPGDPFDLKDWKVLENWLVELLAKYLPEGSRLVVIEHERIAGIHWHVAAAPRWRVSYSPSWNALLNRKDNILLPKVGPVGIAMVPKYRESLGNLQAFEQSLSRTEALVGKLGQELNFGLRESCDGEAVIKLFNSSKVAKIICHGFITPVENTIALLVSHNSVLPLADNFQANTPSGRQHRFDWRECRKIVNGPLVVFSAACSSGRSLHAGIGEKLGLFSVLRGAGTRSFIGPRWDIIPNIVLPILDDAMDRYFSTNEDLGEVLHAACCDASKEHPPWLSWSLALEGDWQ